MHIDDIYYPAVEGNLPLLKERLELRQTDLNQMIDCGVSDGRHTQVFLLFSVINVMHQAGNIRYDVLELLLDYGANPNNQVLVEDDSTSFHIPLLLYPITDWKDPQLLEFLLQHGAYPNSNRLTKYSIDACDLQPMLTFAILNCPGTEEMEILLRYGADPNELTCVYAREIACQQELPPLFYSAVDKASREKTELLLKYGADPACNLDVNVKFRRRFETLDYFYTYYPSAARLLESCLDQVQWGSLHPIKVQYKPRFFQESQTAPPKKASTAEPEAPQDAEGQLRTLALKLINFEFRHSSDYFRGINYGTPHLIYLYWLIPAGICALLFLIDLLVFHRFSLLWLVGAVAASIACYRVFSKECVNAKKRKACGEQVFAQRAEMVRQLNDLSKGLDVPAWWNAAPFEVASRKPSTITPLVWMPINRLRIDPVDQSMALKGYCMETDPVEGKTVLEMIRSGHYRTLLNNGITAGESYRSADLCTLLIMDGTYQYKTSASEESIRRDMEDFHRQEDGKERFWNLIHHEDLSTDQDRYDLSKISYTDLEESRMYRSMRARAYEEKLRSAQYTATTDTDKFYHVLSVIGVIVFNAENRIVGILIIRDGFRKEFYTTDASKRIYRVQEESNPTPKLPQFDMDIIRKLRHLPLDKPDLLARNPGGFTDEEWLEFQYSCARDADYEETIKQLYRDAHEAKQKKLM